MYKRRLDAALSVMQTPFGSFSLQRWPVSSDTSLRAWDAADELLLAHVHDSFQTQVSGQQSRILICNDSHGALSCALHEYAPQSWSDSSLAHVAAKKNWLTNSLAGEPACLDSISTPQGMFDLVLIKVPKTHALLEDQLARIRPLLHENSVIIAASLVRYLQKSAFALFERYIGEVSTSLAKKKARLIFCTPDDTRVALMSPYPDSYTDGELGLLMSNHANVFCREHVDLGARFFISQSHRLPPAGNIIDLACGNGILGIHLQTLQPDARLQFIDESYMAIASARENFARIVTSPTVEPAFIVGNGLEDIASESVDLIICNPPFHVQHAIADDTARLFFRQASHCLRADGQLWIVANRHLPYKAYLKRCFAAVDVIAGNGVFVVLKASAV